MKTILFVGGTGAQGEAIIKVLAATGHYHIRIFARDITSSHAQELTSLQHVEAVLNPSKHSYDLEAFEAAAKDVDGVFLNTNTFAIGEIAETYWGIRLYESAVKAHAKHVVWSGLDDAYRDSGYDPSLYAIHYQGKSRVQAFIKAQPKSSTAWTITRTGPYIQMLSERMIPQVDDKGTYNFLYPLGDGEIVFIDLYDYARYIDWIFQHPERSAGLDLGIGVSHASGQDIADAFTAVTGKPAAYQSVPDEAWAKEAFGRFPKGGDTLMGFQSTTDESTLTLTWGENFVHFFNLWKASKGNVGLIKRDYKLLDEILPDRVKSVKEWMEREKYTAEPKNVLER